MLPKCGFQSSLILCASVYALLGILFLPWNGWRSNRLVTALLYSLVALLIVVFVTFPYQRDEVHFANARRLYEFEEQHLVRRIEGTANTWQLLRRDLFGEPYYYRLLADGFSMSATNPRIQRYMRLFAYLPLTLRPFGMRFKSAETLVTREDIKRFASEFDPQPYHLDEVAAEKSPFKGLTASGWHTAAMAMRTPHDSPS